MSAGDLGMNQTPFLLSRSTQSREEQTRAQRAPTKSQSGKDGLCGWAALGKSWLSHLGQLSTSPSLSFSFGKMRMIISVFEGCVMKVK